MSTDLSEDLLRYFALRDRQRAEAVQSTLAAMTERERALVQEAAVMAYVQGVQSVPGGHSQSIPTVSQILVRVVDATCHSMPDLYPVMSGLTESAEGAGR